MRILHLTEKDYKTSTWSGGTTTELFIWPKGADYANELASHITTSTLSYTRDDDVVYNVHSYLLRALESAN